MMEPVVGLSSPAIKPSSVDLPLPDGPTIATICFVEMSRDTSSKMVTARPPAVRRIVKFFIEIMMALSKIRTDTLLYGMALYFLQSSFYGSRLLAVVLVFGFGVSGCDPAPEPPASTTPSSGPRDRFGQRLGTDVTSQPGRSTAAVREDRPRIVAFGDSLTAGLGVAQEEAYPAQLQRRLDASGY